MSDIITLDATCLYSGNRVLHVYFNGKNAWVPKPPCTYEHDENKLYIPRHIAVEKGLIQ